MLTKQMRFDDDVVVVLRNQVRWSEDGLLAEMPQLDARLYQKVKKAFEALGGKWNRKAGATLFESDPRAQVEGLVTHGVLSVARDGFFRTPKEVVWRMFEYAPMGDFNYNTLEPECGDGAIIEVLIQMGFQRERLYCIEQNPKRCQIVRESWPGVRVACGNFLRFRNSAHIPFRRIFMNPPFEQGQDAEHVMKAYELLDINGIMVAIMGEGVFFRDDRKSEAFRQWCRGTGLYSERLPEHSFRQSGTDVRTRLCVLEK
jgi:hypothetical protein